MIRVTRQIKCLIAPVPGGHTLSLPEVNFLIVEIPTPEQYVIMIRMTMQLKCLIAQAPGGIPHPYIGCGMFCIKVLQSRMQGERHRLSSMLSL